MYETYEDHSTWGLMGLAEIFRANLAAVNTANTARGRLDRAAQPASRVVASASGGTLRLNFSSRAVLKLIMDDLADAEGVIDEGWRRIPGEPHYPARYASLLVHLEREARDCLDRHLGKNLRDIDDFLKIPAAIAREFRP